MMNPSRFAISLVLTVLMAGTIVPKSSEAAETRRTGSKAPAWLSSDRAGSAGRNPNGKPNSFDRYAGHGINSVWTIAPRRIDGGIREEVPPKYRERFEEWKTDLLSTDFGREQWDRYANNKNFILRIVVAGSRERGAGTDKFVWDETGRLIGATITLGAKIDEGFPSPIYYPVLNSLSFENKAVSVDGRILAATKISHELGHVNQASAANMKDLQLQNRLTPQYVSIFLSNGLDTSDKQLVDLARQMGGTPIEIWENREYLSEVNAMLYLDERISNEPFYCQVFNKIRRNLQTYAPGYQVHFGARPEYSGSTCWK